MAGALVNRTQVGAKEFGRYVDVPEVPKAKLMYYLDSICYALNLDKSEPNIRKLRDYTNHRRLTQDETDELLILCILFSPDVLLNKVIFMDEEMCENDMNKFYEVEAVSNRFLVTEDIVIGGQRRHVSKILCFREIWIEFCYLEPIKHFQSRLSEIGNQIGDRQNPRQQAATPGPSVARRPLTSGQARPSPQPSRTPASQPSRAPTSQPSRAPASQPPRRHQPAPSSSNEKSCTVM